ncbi:acyltransferase domain-containing protein [Streptomyces sp. ACA25]|uniref:acyltransferase domain-containing protein n=1 Tax=Streptomyces sp. ACA25 TaxID=3022596 RepID=UPI0023070F12|nr:acyltransferase domain-containing protein [Streptomyces sp. ACA25]MDB1089570.1 acyltransferase domain-containing protein [Streptomyces sp. ACA25]
MTMTSVPPREHLYRDWLLERLSHYLGRRPAPDSDFAVSGLDSVAALSLYGDIEEAFGPLVEPTDIREYPTARLLARHLACRDVRPGAGHRVRTAFVFTGLGAQHPGMTAALYIQCPDYRTALDEAAEALLPYTGVSVVDLILSGDTRLHQTAFAQPSLFAVGYALARMLEQAGVVPAAVLGQGIGEYAAAVVVGALTLPDAAKLVAIRGAFLQYLPSGGGMMATGLSPYEAAHLAAPEATVGIGVINGPRSTVLSGDRGALERIEDQLRARGQRCIHLPGTHAFHSPLMEPAVPRFEAVARRLPGGAPRLPFYSTVRGRLTTEPLHSGYWTEQITAPVRFAEAARQLLDQQAPSHVVEIGPRTVLIPYLRRLAGRGTPACRMACAGPRSGAEEVRKLLAELQARPVSAPVGS